MVKGCQKRIIMVNNTGSRYFDTAYFILKNDLPATCSERDMINEAQSIINACSVEQFISSQSEETQNEKIQSFGEQNETAFRVYPEKRRKESAKKHRLSSVFAFFSGAATVGLVAAAISVIANLL